MKILLASGNRGKVTELRAILSEVVPGIEIVGLKDIPAYPETPETELTFAGNALLKARDGAKQSGLPCVADDSGLAVEALNGMPGVLSARWSGLPKDDERNNRLLLDQLADVPEGKRQAKFVCAAAIVWPDGRHEVVEADMPGRIGFDEHGENGFGYDPLFVADGQEVTNAQLTPEVKNRLSHRGQAFRKLARHIAGT
ncbi:RdgB/HAM1 family non-canonical purine NTP pyrophosphatase [Natronoglycomyces albus]|uniref:dITP/XTP pyrophosphatase n=1 Tax=Natronoglycomyces albus TaxID=2811108 RepID=A0A895XMF2_9ACTN|nr:RdgB/HAM1 family non-canonical purine NTP pyrophosphatase [Natronoglycomyces albus]QSB04942.1 RdgB/HAM1 family non-canonical purine NTP pyrophosphatase [Natronoglycomyces albus]